MMRRTLSLATLATTLACAGVTDLSDVSAPTGLVGTWQSPRVTLSPAGAMQTTLRFGADGKFVAEVRSYGLYPGQAAGELSAYSRISGSYTTDDAALDLAPAQLVWWDRFYGANSPEQVVVPYPYGDLYDDARYEVRGEFLTLHYVTYPADAPEATSATFGRVR